VGDRTRDVSVVICTYTAQRGELLAAAIESVRRQTLPPREIVVVVDHDPGLLRRARERWPEVVAVENAGAPGLSGARTTGVAAARGTLVAFLDDDAVAAPDWLERIIEPYANPAVVGVGGEVAPRWPGSRPRWFPPEFDWVVGCTYRGMPVRTQEVRNVIGANMSFRRDVLLAVGGFRPGLGRVGALAFGCEETDLCIRIRSRLPNSVLIYHPQARVTHTVSAARATWGYFVTRCHAEGLSKAALTRLVGTRAGLASERRYVLRTLPGGVARAVGVSLRHGEPDGLLRAAVIVTGLLSTAMGYVTAALRGIGKDEALAQPPSIDSASDGTRSREALASRLRLLMVTPRYAPDVGGVETHVHEVSRRLADAGVDVTVLTTDREGKRPRVEVSEGVAIRRVRAWPPRRDYYFAPGIYRVIKKGRWDLVHVQSYHTLVAPLAMLAARRAGMPYIVTFHRGGHSSRVRRSLRGLQWATLRPLLARAERLVAIARFELEELPSKLRIPRGRFVLVPNGADLPDRPPNRALPTRPQAPVIASIGRLERYKGHQRVIDALPYVLAHNPRARLRILGTGPYEGVLRRLARKRGVADYIEISSIAAGDRDAMASALHEAALVVLLSEYETHPLAVLEALRLGRPALVAETSGLLELAQLSLARSVSLRSTPVEVARAIIEQLDEPLIPGSVVLPTWDDCAQSLLAVYRGLREVEPCES
jgi:glycogen synthase